MQASIGLENHTTTHSIRSVNETCDDKYNYDLPAGISNISAVLLL